MEQTYPYSDNNMIYDKDSHMYILTPYYCVNELGLPEDLGLKNYNEQKKSAAVQRFLKRVSSIVYRYIYSHTSCEPVVEYIIAKGIDIRPKFMEALSEQVLYVIKNGDLGLYSGVDYKKGTMLDVPIHKAISPYTRDILNECGLLYTGERHVPYGFKYREDY